MKSTKTIDSKSSNISKLLIYIVGFSMLFILDFPLEGLPWYLIPPIKILAIAPFVFVVSFGKAVRLKNSTLQYGKYYLYFKFKAIIEIPVEDINEIEISKNAENYFEIVAHGKSDKIVIKEIANKKPAEKELEEIKRLIKTSANCR